MPLELETVVSPGLLELVKLDLYSGACDRLPPCGKHRRRIERRLTV